MVGLEVHTWNTRCYHYHRELKELLGGFNDIRAIGKGIREVCNCNWSNVYVVVPNAKNLLLIMMHSQALQ